jgi:hypothetical protein
MENIPSAALCFGKMEMAITPPEMRTTQQLTPTPFSLTPRTGHCNLAMKIKYFFEEPAVCRLQEFRHFDKEFRE